jgi:hypothetical protein
MASYTSCLSARSFGFDPAKKAATIRSPALRNPSLALIY